MEHSSPLGRMVAGLVLGAAFAAPCAAASRAELGPAHPQPRPVFDGATVSAPIVVAENLTPGSAALVPIVPIMAADVAAAQDVGHPPSDGEPVKTVDDLAFVARAAESSQLERNAASDALPRLRDLELKRLAATLITHHDDANARLSEIARAKGWPVPGLRGDSPAVAAGTASGDFDARWSAEMIANHERTVALYRAQAQNGEDKDLRNYARETLPTLEQHLDWLRRSQK